MDLTNLRHEALVKALADMRAKGATGLKVELEAQLNRFDDEDTYCPDCDEGSQRCEICDGSGARECPDCEGSGTAPMSSAMTDALGVLEAAGQEADATALLNNREECERCEGDGQINCDDCDGGGYITCSTCDGDWSEYRRRDGNWSSEYACLEYILCRIGELTNAPVWSSSIIDGGDECAYTEHPYPWLTYMRFYNDHSVDSELTFTIPLDSVETIEKLPIVLQAFKDLANEVGNGMDVAGAGMHTAVLFTDGAVYPGHHHLTNMQLNNFARAMTQLLPALYFLGTSTERSRGLSYREPRVFIDGLSRDRGSSKYSAIFFNDGALEFRVFDTCYETTDAILDNVVVIANSMKYLDSTYRNPGLDKIARSFNFGVEYGRTVDRFYTTITHLDFLSAGLSKLKPRYYTIPDLKRQRQFKRTKRGLQSIERRERRKAMASYREYCERYDWSALYREVEIRSNILRHYIEGRTNAELAAMDKAALQEEVERQVAIEMENYRNRKTAEERYIQIALEDWQASISGRYAVTL